MLQRVNADAPDHGRVRYVEQIAFGSNLEIERFELDNGLQVLLCVDRAAPVIAYHTWFRVGSRHEKPGKTGLAHLLEHLMFNEVEGLPSGAFDTLMEQAGAENNASTWLDFTQYQEAFPKAQLPLIVGLEARRLSQLVLRQPQLDSEKEVVENERRYRVEDDVQGMADELLYKTAFTRHPYSWPTIGWMADIQGFETADCAGFYRTYYAPNNASLVVVGDLNEAKTLRAISQAYGRIPPSNLPVEDTFPEPVQASERIAHLVQPTSTEKLSIGYKGPALGDADHVPATVLVEILTGGRSSRLYKKLVSGEELGTEVRGSVGPHKDPGLIELFVSAREGVTGERLLALIDAELEAVLERPVDQEEIERAVARAELGLLGSLETADGKAGTIGFYECILGQPAAAFERLARMRRTTQSDVLRAARRYLQRESRTVVFVHREQA